MKKIESGKQIDALYLDFSKAFDSLSHQLLVKKLSKYGASFAATSWMASYLTGRKLRVRVGQALSNPFFATSGVPQGSHLGPLLFLLYVQDLSLLLQGTDNLLYADDLKISYPIDSEDDCLRLQQVLTLVAGWGERNHLHLNSSKCQVISFNRCRTKINFTYHLDDNLLQRVDEVKDLGVMLDEKLTFKRHMDRVISKCRSTLGLVKRFTKEFEDVTVARTLYCSLVRTIVEYAAPAWTPYHTTHIARIESIQKQFVLFALGRQRIPGSYALLPYKHRLSLLGLDRLCDRSKTHCATFVFDILMGRIQCDELRTMIAVNPHRRVRRNRYLLEAFHRTNYGRHEPINKCVMIFNSVADIFKSGLSRTGFIKATCAFLSEAD